jgi:hypothetical protein
MDDHNRTIKQPFISRYLKVPTLEPTQSHSPTVRPTSWTEDGTGQLHVTQLITTGLFLCFV